MQDNRPNSTTSSSHLHQVPSPSNSSPGPGSPRSTHPSTDPSSPSSSSSSPSSSDSDSDIDDDNTYKCFMESFSKKWLDTQLTHQVSLKAAESFWDLAVCQLGKILEKKKEEKVKKKIPLFVTQKRKLYKELAPEVKMSFVFKKLDDGTIIKVNSDHAPLTQYQRNPNYQKLYEEAHVEVNFNIIIYFDRENEPFQISHDERSSCTIYALFIIFSRLTFSSKLI